MAQNKEKAQPEENSPIPEEKKKDWYILKVQVNREDSISENLRRRIKLAGYEQYFDNILVPVEKVSEIKNGQKRVSSRKLFPGYIMVNMEINDATWFLVRETPGVGDFTGTYGKPVAMPPQEVQRILQTCNEKVDEAPKLKIPYQRGDRVKITDGSFKDVEGEVTAIDDVVGRVTVSISLFNRSTPVDLEYWQATKVEG